MKSENTGCVYRAINLTEHIPGKGDEDLSEKQ